MCTRKELESLCTVKKSGTCPYFKAVVLVDGVTANASEMAQQVGLEVYSFAKVEAGMYQDGLFISPTLYFFLDINSNQPMRFFRI